jgi:hypothetical protein
MVPSSLSLSELPRSAHSRCNPRAANIPENTGISTLNRVRDVSQSAREVRAALRSVRIARGHLHARAVPTLESR